MLRTASLRQDHAAQRDSAQKAPSLGDAISDMTLHGTMRSATQHDIGQSAHLNVPACVSQRRHNAWASIDCTLGCDFIPMPLPKGAQQTSLCTHLFSEHVLQTLLGTGMGMNVTAHTRRRRGGGGGLGGGRLADLRRPAPRKHRPECRHGRHMAS